MWFENVCLKSNVNPNIYTFLFVENVVLFIISFSLIECSAECGMNTIVCVFERFKIKLFCIVQLYMSCKHECTCFFAALMFVWLERIVISSAYVISFIFSFSDGMSEVHRLNSVGESPPPCGTHVSIVACFDFLCLFLKLQDCAHT